MLAVLTFHLTYGIALYTAIESGIAPDRLPAIWTAIDILFATAAANAPLVRFS
jgi:hypothetical protein